MILARKVYDTLCRKHHELLNLPGSWEQTGTSFGLATKGPGRSSCIHCCSPHHSLHHSFLCHLVIASPDTGCPTDWGAVVKKGHGGSEQKRGRTNGGRPTRLSLASCLQDFKAQEGDCSLFMACKLPQIRAEDPGGAGEKMQTVRAWGTKRRRRRWRWRLLVISLSRFRSSDKAREEKTPARFCQKMTPPSYLDRGK